MGGDEQTEGEVYGSVQERWRKRNKEEAWKDKIKR